MPTRVCVRTIVPPGRRAGGPSLPFQSSPRSVTRWAERCLPSEWQAAGRNQPAMIGRRFSTRTSVRALPVVESDDAALLVLAIGDPHAFAPIFDRYWDPVYRYCRYRLQHREDAEDAAIQILTNAYTGLRRFSGGSGSFRSWLFAIAHN